MPTQNTSHQPRTSDDDLQALADEIAADTGAPALDALRLAGALRPTLRQYIGRWNAAVRRARAATRATKTDTSSKSKR